MEEILVFRGRKNGAGRWIPLHPREEKPLSTGTKGERYRRTLLRRATAEPLPQLMLQGGCHCCHLATMA